MDNNQRKSVADLLRSQPKRVFHEKEILSLLASSKKQLSLARKPAAELLADLEDSGILERKILTSEKYAPFVRLALPEASIFEIALSLRPGSFFSHGTALFLHGLTMQLPRTIYVNKEQSEKPAPTGSLSQPAIDRAFSGPQRESTYVLQLDDWRCVLLNGKNSGLLEVGEIPAPGGASVPATKVERTLIDIAVRPNYAGGVHQVLEAYQSARDRISINVLIATLKKMQYVYPYHQLIGFYLQRAGVEESRLQRLRELGLHFDFYLTYGMQETEYDPAWRVFIPKSLAPSSAIR